MGLGNCEFGSVTFKSAAYVARYIMKRSTEMRRLFIIVMLTRILVKFCLRLRQSLVVCRVGPVLVLVG